MTPQVGGLLGQLSEDDLLTVRDVARSLLLGEPFAVCSDGRRVIAWGGSPDDLETVNGSTHLVELVSAWATGRPMRISWVFTDANAPTATSVQ